MRLSFWSFRYLLRILGRNHMIRIRLVPLLLFLFRISWRVFWRSLLHWYCKTCLSWRLCLLTFQPIRWFLILVRSDRTLKLFHWLFSCSRKARCGQGSSLINRQARSLLAFDFHVLPRSRWCYTFTSCQRSLLLVVCWCHYCSVFRILAP